MDIDDKLQLYYLHRLILWRKRLDALDAAAEQQLATALRKARKEVVGRLEASAAGLVQVPEWTHERLATVGRYLDDMLAVTKRDMESLITRTATLTAENSLAEYGDMLSLGGASSRVGQVDLTAAQLSAWFATTPLGGQALATWVEKAFANGVRESVLTALQAGALQGKGTASLVRSAMQAAWDTGQAITKREAITLVRTYTQTANVNAMSAVYEANDNIVQGWQWCATMEAGYKTTGRGTCLRCAALDGQVFPLKQGPPCPLHARCRCVKLPKLKSWKALGLDLPEVEAVTRPYVVRPDQNIDAGGRRTILEVGFAQGDYSTWLAGQSDAMQRTIMGQKRFALYKAGKADLHDFVDAQGRLVPLEELGRGKGWAAGVEMQPSRLAPTSNRQDVITKLLGAKQGVPIAMEEAALQANPHFMESAAFQNNCQRSIVAYELRRRGYDVEALPYPRNGGTSKRDKFFGWECFENAKVYGLAGGDTKLNRAGLMAALNAMPDSARAGIFWMWPGNQSGHIIICEKVGNNLHFIDPQRGIIDVAMLGKAGIRSGYSYFRMDNLNLVENFEWDEIVKGNGK